jgi:hypothetical protein
VNALATAANITANDASICSGNTVTLTASAVGVLHPVFTWDASANTTVLQSNASSYTTSALTANETYYVSVSGDNLCENASSDRKYVSVTMNSLATAANITANDASVCPGDAATLTASASGVTNPVFTWYASDNTVLSTGASYTTPALTTGETYYVSVSGDNLCENAPSDRKTVTVTINSLPTVTLASSQTITTRDSIVLMTFTGTAPWTVTYNDGTSDRTISGISTSSYVFIPMAAGTFTFNLVSVSDAFCSNSATGSAVITVTSAGSSDASLINLWVSDGALNPVFDATVTYYEVAVQNAVDSITIFAQTTDPNATISGTGRFALSVGDNWFSVVVTAEDGVTVRTYTVKVYRGSVGIDEPEEADFITLYPNPTQDVLNIVSSLPIEQVFIYDVSGRLVRRILNPDRPIPVSDLATGVYMVKIQTSKGIEVKRVIKQ